MAGYQASTEGERLEIVDGPATALRSERHLLWGWRVTLEIGGQPLAAPGGELGARVVAAARRPPALRAGFCPTPPEPMPRLWRLQQDSLEILNVELQRAASRAAARVAAVGALISGLVAALVARASGR